MSTYGNVSVALNATELVNISNVTVPDVRPCHLSEVKIMTLSIMNQCFLARLQFTCHTLCNFLSSFGIYSPLF